MGRFNKAKAAAPVPEGEALQRPALTPLGALLKVQPAPLGLVSTMARITYIFGHTAGALVMRAWEWI